MTRLWETDHPYYGAEGCFYANGHHHDYKTWSDFLEDWADADEDMNYIYRFDWREGEDWGVKPGTAELWVHFVMQRKAFTTSACVQVTRDQEPEIRDWLAKRWRHVCATWTPFAHPTQQEERA